MAGKKTVALGIYTTRASVENAVDALKVGGFQNIDVSVLFPYNKESKDFAAPEETAAGLAGIGALAIPGLGSFIAAGPIMAALTGVGVGSMVGGVARTLVGMGIPEYEAKRYERHVKDGGILLFVHCDDSSWAKKAKKILEHTGAEDVRDGYNTNNHLAEWAIPQDSPSWHSQSDIYNGLG